MDLNLSIVSDEELDCYNKSEGKPVHTNIDDDLQLLLKGYKLTPVIGNMTCADLTSKISTVLNNTDIRQRDTWCY